MSESNVTIEELLEALEKADCIEVWRGPPPKWAEHRTDHWEAEWTQVGSHDIWIKKVEGLW